MEDNTFSSRDKPFGGEIHQKLVDYAVEKLKAEGFS
ncbi:unnamed protein product, partial [marine sediment metagenome]